VEREAIEVMPEGRGRFRARIDGHAFEVSAAEPLVTGLGAPDAETLVRASFEFLLAREPVSSILPRFDLAVIERYFPEWREEMRKRFRPCG
jgi:hypothetical protein